MGSLIFNYSDYSGIIGEKFVIDYNIIENLVGESKLAKGMTNVRFYDIIGNVSCRSFYIGKQGASTSVKFFVLEVKKETIQSAIANNNKKIPIEIKIDNSNTYNGESGIFEFYWDFAKGVPPNSYELFSSQIVNFQGMQSLVTGELGPNNEFPVTPLFNNGFISKK